MLLTGGKRTCSMFIMNASNNLNGAFLLEIKNKTKTKQNSVSRQAVNKT